MSAAFLQGRSGNLDREHVFDVLRFMDKNTATPKQIYSELRAEGYDNNDFIDGIILQVSKFFITLNSI